MNDILSPLDGALVISNDQIPFTAYQAIYHKVTRKVESLSRRYREAYTISYEDVANLAYRLQQILAQYAVKGQRVQVSHAIREGFSTTYSSFEKFSKADVSHRECTSAFDFELDFLIVLPAEIPEAKDIAQRYKLNLTYQRGFEGDEDVFAPYFMDVFKNRSSLYMRLEYSDYAVAQTINATLQSWINGLPKTEISGLVRWVMKNEEVVTRHIGPLIGSIAPLSSAYYLTHNSMPISAALTIILIAIACAAITNSVIGQVADAGYSVIRRVAADIDMVLTQGDKDRLSKNDAAKARIRKYLTFASISICAAIAINLFSSWVYDSYLR